MEKEYIETADLEELEKLYNDAVNNKEPKIKFKNYTLSTSYTKYVIEYLKTKKNYV